MNTRHHIAPFRLAVLLLALPAPTSLAQAFPEPAALPEGIEATGDTAEVRALTAWAEEHRYSHPEQAERIAQRALLLARNIDDQRGIGVSSTILGHLATTSDLSRAETYYTEAQELFEQIGDERGLNRIRLGMGDVYSYRGELEQAATFYFDALEGFKHLSDTEGQAAALNGIGNTLSSQDNLKEALTYFERAVSLVETLDDSLRLVSILNNVGNTLVNLGMYENAETQFRRALAISEDRGARFYNAFLLNNLSRLYNKQGRYEQALPHLFTAERLSNELGDNGLLGAVYDELGKAYMGLSQYDRALHYATESLTLVQEAGSISDQMEIHQTLSQIYEAAGNDGQALAHYRQYASARDSVFNAEKAEIITEMEMHYETEEKQRAIERLEQEARIQSLRQTLLLVGVGGLLLLLALLFNRYRLKQRANRLLEELDAAKSRFFANISHEFRTPLTVILGGLQDALAGRFGTLSKDLAVQNRAMLRNSRQLQGLIDEVLDLGRLEAGRLELKPTPGDLVRSIKRIVETDAPLAERNGIDLMFEHNAETCPRFYDEEKLEKIVGNLLSNALKFTPEGGAVRVELHSNSPVEIVVSDDGLGIPVEMQEKVFERFAQVEDGSHHGGTGIGLALAKELAELHDGTITLESEPGKGSTFTVRLPLEKTTLDEIVGDGHEEKQDVGVPSNGDVGATLVVAQQTEETDDNSDRTTILVIEDNDDVRAYVRRSLEETYRFLEAADGETGLQQARSELPDLIVSDIMLPGIDGYEIARRLKAEPDTECIPVVMLTARAAEKDQTEGYGSGAEVYITKPFSPETLRAAIARLLEERLRLLRRLREEANETEEEEPKNGYPTLRDRMQAAVLEHLHDETFGVKELASTLGMSRYALHHRLKQEAGLSPSDFVRTLRLERARELLTSGAGSVSEVAYAVGFNSLSVFSRNYRAHYGTPPSAHLGQGKHASE